MPSLDAPLIQSQRHLPSLRAMTKAVMFDFMQPRLAGDRDASSRYYRHPRPMLELRSYMICLLRFASDLLDCGRAERRRMLF